MQSEFGKLNLKDIGKAVLVTVLAAFFTPIVAALQAGQFPNGADFLHYGVLGLGAGLAYLAKNLFTNSNNELAAKDPPK